MRVLVLGGTGHLGAAVVHEAIGRGHAVSVATRRELPRSLAGLDVEAVRLDIEERGALRRALHGHALIVDAAAPYPLYAEAGVESRAVARMRLLIRAVADAGARLAYVSSFVTMPECARARAVRTLHPYFAVKQAMEDEVLRACAAGLRAVVVNPTACLGPWDGKPRELSVIPLLLEQRLPATVSAPINVIDVRDVARGLLEAVARERYGVPILLSGHNLGADALADRICQLAGVAAPIARMPLAPAVLGAMWMDRVYATFGRDNPHPAIGLLLTAASGSTEVGEVQRQLGAAPRDLDQTLRDAIAWYRSA